MEKAVNEGARAVKKGSAGWQDNLKRALMPDVRQKA